MDAALLRCAEELAVRLSADTGSSLEPSRLCCKWGDGNPRPPALLLAAAAAAPWKDGGPKIAATRDDDESNVAVRLPSAARAPPGSQRWLPTEWPTAEGAAAAAAAAAPGDASSRGAQGRDDMAPLIARANGERVTPPVAEVPLTVRFGVPLPRFTRGDELPDFCEMPASKPRPSRGDPASCRARACIPSISEEESKSGMARDGWLSWSGMSCGV
jgi:hypothetical protein